MKVTPMAKLTDAQRQERALNRARKAALEAEERDRRREEQRRRSREETRLSQEELQAGVLCPGCGEPINDQLGNWPPPAQMSEEEQRQRDEADARYRERHDQCDSPVRWSTAGSRAEHCLYCCPPPPLNPQAARALLQLISAHEEAQNRGSAAGSHT
ncbi:hypothetical protein GCM10022419_134510 [Nonomuraea rosea]|uniref:Uncharacterized protein n=1 Tax=Nonomuraea rosea TaxID=638574 RepID=A0ABP7A6V7_9ACTN